MAVVGTGFFDAPTLSAVADAVSRLAPAGVRGEATGLQSSALSAGFALGSPLVGVAVDVSVPAGGFAAAGLAGLAATLTGCLLCRRRSSPRPPAPAGHPSGPAGHRGGCARRRATRAGSGARGRSAVRGAETLSPDPLCPGPLPPGPRSPTA
ncbi:hypothetical protein [Streptomyces reniochalinae]|uniref:hypothetical protein n=1 Tax=Streptomyces reniochalinae TaxID=2250578 RepID=UPI003CCC67F1